MNSRESPLGEVANKGLLKPVATIWVCNCATADGIQTVAAKAAASKMEKNLFMKAPWSRVIPGYTKLCKAEAEITKVPFFIYIDNAQSVVKWVRVTVAFFLRRQYLAASLAELAARRCMCGY
jgi:hypothetical protein